jgi:hypothetical protein
MIVAGAVLNLFFSVCFLLFSNNPALREAAARNPVLSC